jgi:hypothetical protein
MTAEIHSNPIPALLSRSWVLGSTPIPRTQLRLHLCMGKVLSLYLKDLFGNQIASARCTLGEYGQLLPWAVRPPPLFINKLSKNTCIEPPPPTLA